ncbi:hypothetical protein AAGG74_17700 [Bacillus mexicanus]|uniref:hypothetical protein n=1 Tax=Bacillus mexicanus TaxID=2834415 RepID=UPI003D1FC620
MERYYAYDFGLKSPIIIDTLEKVITFYNTNIHGQIYNLKDGGETCKISTAKINGLIERLNSGKYSYSNSLVIDKYIYHFIMTDEQREKCIRKPGNLRTKDFYGSGDNLKNIIKIMCEKTFEKTYVWKNTVSEEIQEKDRSEYMIYVQGYLNSNDLIKA